MASARTRRKGLDAARSQVHPTSEPLAYALALGGPAPMRTALLVAGGAVGAAVLLSLAVGAPAGPGWLFALTFWAFNPPRVVVATSNSIVVMGRSMLHGKPTGVRAVVPLEAILPAPVATSGRWGAHRLGDELVWLTRKEAEVVVDAARFALRAYAPVA